MKKLIFSFLAELSVFLLIGCSEKPDTTNYPQYMRDFVQDISVYAKNLKPDFAIIPQNGQELIAVDLEPDGIPAFNYLNAIDGIGREDLFYGYDLDNVATSKEDTDYMMAFLNIAKNNTLKVLVTDYCSTPSYIDNSYNKNFNNGFISFGADSRELDRIPTYPGTPYNVNLNDITTIQDAKNFLYFLSPDNIYSTKSEFLNAIAATNYDIFIIDLFFMGEALDTNDMNMLKTKANGGERLIIAYMSIGEAEDYRYYWQSSWETKPPSWLAGENADWPGNYKVRYWESEWQTIIYGNDNSYLKKIIDAGFDGVYLDIIDAFEYFQNAGKWWMPY
jgi:cysteinyl-tRNA synthetase